MFFISIGEEGDRSGDGGCVFPGRHRHRPPAQGSDLHAPRQTGQGERCGHGSGGVGVVVVMVVVVVVVVAAVVAMVLSLLWWW